MLTVAAVTGSAVVEYLLLNEVEVFKNVRGRLTMMHSYLKGNSFFICWISVLYKIFVNSKSKYRKMPAYSTYSRAG
jgi:hypothetical protein